MPVSTSENRSVDNSSSNIVVVVVVASGVFKRTTRQEGRQEDARAVFVQLFKDGFQLLERQDQQRVVVDQRFGTSQRAPQQWRK